MIVKHLFRDFIGLLFPTICSGCSQTLLENESLICTNCRLEMPITNYHLQAYNPLAQRFWGKVKIENAFAYCKFTKEGIIQNMLHQLKYGGSFEIGVLLGEWYGYQLKQDGITDFDLILPVPLHPKKLLQRGYNQSDAFAKGLSIAMSIDWSPNILIRNTHTATQTKKSRFDRWRNVADIFEVNTSTDLSSKHLLLVDDVITTGSTIESCVEILQKNGAKKISVAAIATP